MPVPVLASCPLYSSLLVQDPHAPPCLQAFDPAVLCLVLRLLSLHMVGFFAPLLLSLLVISSRYRVTSELFIYLSDICPSQETEPKKGEQASCP